MPGSATETFGTLHIALTALVTGVLALSLSAWVLRGKSLLNVAAIGVLAGLAVFLWRQSANMPQLNEDGLSGFSANDWLAPVVVYAVLGCYAALRQVKDAGQFARAQALAAVAALVINVVTI